MNWAFVILLCLLAFELVAQVAQVGRPRSAKTGGEAAGQAFEMLAMIGLLIWAVNW